MPSLRTILFLATSIFVASVSAAPVASPLKRDGATGLTGGITNNLGAASDAINGVLPGGASPLNTATGAATGSSGVTQPSTSNVISPSKRDGTADLASGVTNNLGAASGAINGVLPGGTSSLNTATGAVTGGGVTQPSTSNVIAPSKRDSTAGLASGVTNNLGAASSAINGALPGGASPLNTATGAVTGGGVTQPSTSNVVAPSKRDGATDLASGVTNNLGAATGALNGVLPGGASPLNTATGVATGGSGATQPSTGITSTSKRDDATDASNDIGAVNTANNAVGTVSGASGTLHDVTVNPKAA